MFAFSHCPEGMHDFTFRNILNEAVNTCDLSEGVSRLKALEAPKTVYMLFMLWPTGVTLCPLHLSHGSIQCPINHQSLTLSGTFSNKTHMTELTGLFVAYLQLQSANFPTNTTIMQNNGSYHKPGLVDTTGRLCS